MNYLCAVSPRFPENYQIGVLARKWGVEERYEKRIRPVQKGDLVVFIVSGEFRSIHTIESGCYKEMSLLWPEKQGSVFPFRVDISDPMMTGRIPVSKISDRISFMRGKQWGGTIQGANGVFNNKLNAQDLDVIRSRMIPVKKKAIVYKVDFKALARQRGGAQTLAEFLGPDAESELLLALRNLGFEQCKQSRREALSHPDSVALTCRDRDGQTVVVQANKGKASVDRLIQILHCMSALKKNSSVASQTRGILMVEKADHALRQAVEAVPNVEIREYRVKVVVK